MANKVNFDTAQKLDIICRRGDTFTLTLTIKGPGDVLQDLTGDQFGMQVRDKATSDGSNGILITTNPNQINEFGVNDGTGPCLSGADVGQAAVFTLNRGTSATGGTQYGVLTVSASNDEMAKVSSGRYVYDLQRYDVTAGTHKTLITGSFTVKEDITEGDNS